MWIGIQCRRDVLPIVQPIRRTLVGDHAAATAATAAAAMTALTRLAYNGRPSADTDHPVVRDLARPLDVSKHSRRRCYWYSFLTRVVVSARSVPLKIGGFFTQMKKWKKKQCKKKINRRIPETAEVVRVDGGNARTGGSHTRTTTDGWAA